MLEGRILDAENWSNVLIAMGLSAGDIDAGAVLVVGNALNDLVGRMRDCWQAARDKDGLAARV